MGSVTKSCLAFLQPPWLAHQVRPCNFPGKNTGEGYHFLLHVMFSSWLSWWLRWQRICLQCRRPGFDPWVGKIPPQTGVATHSSIFGEFHPRVAESQTWLNDWALSNWTNIPMKRQRLAAWTFFSRQSGNFLVVQWLSLHVSTGGGMSSISGQGVKILHAARPKKPIIYYV